MNKVVKIWDVTSVVQSFSSSKGVKSISIESVFAAGQNFFDMSDGRW